MENGLREKIWMLEGKILDGRNRFEACQKMGVQPEYREYTGNNPIGFVVSMNIHRRHLDKSQLAVIALDIEKIEAERAKERQGARTDISAKVHESSDGRSDQKAGESVGVSGRYVSDAKKIQKEAPELIDKIRSGELTISKAKKQVNQKERQERFADAGALPAEKFRVIYADPPWRYEHSSTDARKIENHYPTMALEDIRAVPVDEISDKDCVLFLWATSPKIEEALSVMRSWGFTYRTQAIWVKPQIGMGYYFRQQHEILLVGARGAPPVPNESARVPSVYTESRGAHSAKPAHYYSLIERMYPGAKKVELFSRSPQVGWTAWGNQVEAA